MADENSELSSVATEQPLLVGARVSSHNKCLLLGQTRELKLSSLRFACQLLRKKCEQREAGLGNLSTKTGSETGFLAQNLDRLLDRDFQGRI
jgi:hypothetical protein